MYKLLKVLSGLSFILLLTYTKLSYSKDNILPKSNLFEDKRKSSIYSLLFEDLNNFISTLVASIDPTNLKKESNNIDIISDYKIRKDDVLEAKGNVVVKYNDSILNADYLSYNFAEKYVKVKGNITFRKNDQFFKANTINYDFKNKRGNLFDIYGNINFKNLDKILIKNKNTSITKNQKNNEITIQSVNSFGFEREQNNKESIAFKNFLSDVNNINKWRFQTKEIELSEDQLFSKKIYLSNDPLDPVQLKIISLDFKIKKEEDKLNFYTKWNTLVLEDKFKLPLGRKSIKESDPVTSRWGIGYDKKEKDGFFIKRNYRSKDISDNIKLKFSNYFLIQRAILNKTYSFPIKNSALGTKNSETSINLYDLFGTDANLTGNLSNWDLKLASEINSLRFDRFYNNLKFKGELSKEIDFLKIEDVNFGIYGSFRNKVWNINSGEFEVYSSYGVKAVKEKSFIEKNISKYYAAGISMGQYRAISKPISNLTELWRASLYARKQNKYPIIRFRKNKENYNNYKFKPENLSPGIDLISDLRLYSSIYSDDSIQNVLFYRLGPEMKFGEYNKNFLDFTKVSLIAEQVFRNGESPFYFDHWSKYSTRLFLDFEQQIIGGLSAGLKTYYYINSSDNLKNDFLNTVYKISWNRRAYNIQLYYQDYNKVGGIKFTLFGLNSPVKENPINKL